MPMFRRSMALLLIAAAVAAGWSMYGLYGEDRIELASSDKEQSVNVQPGGFLSADVPSGSLQPGSGESFQSDTRQTAVYVTGEVRSPGVVYVAFDGRVADAVNACGGLLPTADVNRVNMAQPVKDGLHIKVPEKQAVAGNASTAAGGIRPGAAGNAGDTGMVSDGQGAGGGKGRAAKAGREQPEGEPEGYEDSGGSMVNINTADADELMRLKGIGPAMARRIVEYREENGAFQSPEELQRVKGIGKAKFAKLKRQIVL